MRFLLGTSSTSGLIENSKYLFFFLPLIFIPAGFEFFETPKYYFLVIFAFLTLLVIKFKSIKFNSFSLIAFVFYILLNLVSSAQIFFKESFYGLDFLRYNSLLFLFILLVFFIFFAQTKFPKNYLNNIESYFLVGVFIASTLGIIQFLIKPLNLISLEWYFDGRIVSTLGHPNFLAGVIVIGLILLERIRIPWVYLTLILALVMTFSKTSILIYFLYSFVKYIKKLYLDNRKIAVTLGLLSFALMLAIASGLFSNTYNQVIDNQPSRYQFQRFMVFLNPEETSKDFRFDMWQEALNAIKDSPLIGYGKGQIIRVIEIPRDDNLSISSTHNLYLDIAIESGLLGLTSFLIFLFISLYNSFRFDRYLFLIQLFITIHGLFDITPVIFWFIFIFISGISINKYNKVYLKQL